MFRDNDTNVKGEVYDLDPFVLCDESSTRLDAEIVEHVIAAPCYWPFETFSAIAIGGKKS